MKLIVFSDAENPEHEHVLINRLFEEGMDCFHLRKPGMDFDGFEKFLKNISPSRYNRIVIHGHYKLLEKYNLKGLHLTGDYLRSLDKNALEEIFKTARSRKIEVSRSVHTLEELEEIHPKFSYVFLSPVFDSISKSGYAGRFDLTETGECLKTLKTKKPKHPAVIALGGIDAQNIKVLAETGFKGIALLGAVWEAFKTDGLEKSIEKYRLIRSLYTTEFFKATTA